MAVSQKTTFACLPDRISNPPDVFAFTEGSEASSDFVSENLANDVLSKTWRSSGIDVKKTHFTANWGIELPIIESVAMVGHNLSVDDLVRVRGDSAGLPITPFETRVPVGTITDYTGFTDDAGGTPPIVGDINEGVDFPDSLFMKGATGTFSQVVIPMDTPSTPEGGFDIQEFRVRVKVGVGSSDQDMQVKLYEGGSFIKSLVNASTGSLDLTVPGDGTEVVGVYRWDSALITDPADVEIHIGMDTVGGNALYINAVEWNVAKAALSATVYDSGWVSPYDTFASQAFGDASLSDIGSGINWTYSTLFPAPETLVAIRVDFVVNLKEFAEVGRLLAGPIWVPEFSASYGWSIGVEDSSVVKQSLAGSTFVRPKFKKRTLNLTISDIDNEEMLQNSLIYLDLNLGVGAGVVVIIEPLRAGVQTLQNGYYRLKSTGQYVNDYFNKMSRTYEFVEW